MFVFGQGKRNCGKGKSRSLFLFEGGNPGQSILQCLRCFYLM